MKNENYVEIDLQLVIKMFGGVLLMCYLIFLLGKYNERKKGQDLSAIYTEVEQTWKEQELKKTLADLKTPSVEDFTIVRQQAEHWIYNLNTHGRSIYHQLLVKREGAFYDPMSVGYACDEEIIAYQFLSNDKSKIDELLANGENQMEQSLFNSEGLDYRNSSKSIYYILDFDPSNTAVLKIHLIE